jgi:hypothetical protein
MSVSNEDKKRIYEQFRVSVGAPLRQIELTDDMLCVLLDISIEDYSQYVQEWLVEHQWQSLLGKDVSTTDMAFALSVRDFDYMTQYTYAYSKQVGLQSRGPWELKKDYIDIEAGRQVYEIPAGREVNEVLWITPPTTRMALFANYAGIDYGFAGGFGQVGSGGAGGAGMGFGGNGGYYISPAYDILLTAADLNIKNRLLRSELVYKLTAGPNGTRLLHLLSVPGSKMSFGHGIGGAGNSVSMGGCQVWYHYYDTTGGDVEACREENSDIIKLPNEVPLAKLDFSKFNEPTKVLIRQLFVSEAKRTLGRTRGKFGGIVGPPEAERTMDFDTLLSEGNEEKKAILERLDVRLDRLSSTKQLERGANEAESLNKSLKYRPLGFYIK